MLTLCAVSLVMGIVTEALAYGLKLWLYRKASLRVLNIVLVFGLIYGGMSWLLADQGVLAQFVAGAGFGLAYEIVNDRWLKAWYFPGGTLTWLRGQPAVIGVGLAWGLVPVIAVALTRMLT